MAEPNGLSSRLIIAGMAIALVSGAVGYLIGANRGRLDSVVAPDKPKSSEPSSRPQPGPNPIDTAQSHPVDSTEERPSKAAEAAPLKSSIKQQVLESLEKMNGNWRSAFAEASKLAKLEPGVVLEALKGKWSSLSVEDQQQILKAFHMAEFPLILDVLDLGMQDPPTAVRSWAVQILKSYVLQDFGADQAAYLEWKRANQGRSLAEAVQQGARAFVDRMAGASPAQAKELFGFLVNERNKPTLQSLVDAGFLAAAERALAKSSPEDLRVAFRALGEMPLDEGFMRRNVVPLLEGDGESSYSAYRLMGKPQHKWAVDVLLPHLQSSSWKVVTGSAEALGAIGDARAIPFMIETIRRNPTRNGGYDIGYYGLSQMTGVTYDASHDAAWWTDWWQKNQARFTAQK